MAAGTGFSHRGATMGESRLKFSCQWTERNLYLHSSSCASVGVLAVAMATCLRCCLAGISQDLSLRAKSFAAEQRDAACANGAGKRCRAMESIGVAYCPDC